ncbi:hypothetical protein Q1W73_01270 [Asticcacaulis sp. ZE23SCel15]|uniref:hypothetical protein n=1 Tax=Asticcacaulis sp. ZE23SCel15 TaxID=3059027 RepID=UPI00265E8EE2|nr:hypothetical protein [Asticcacaulis sp. ZE23SCel15]WKL57646.1 hypothetical protein Q1W73_01270 [Asticcacaulis sp. ZE23SCel15]
MDKQLSDTLVEHDLPVGYRIGDFENVQSALSTDLPDDRILDVLLYAGEQSCGADRTPLPHHDWQGLRDQAGRLLIARMTATKSPPIDANWYDLGADWNDRKLRHARKVFSDLSHGDLLTLFLQTAENAYYHEGTPKQARWEAFSARCREEIIRRTKSTVTGRGETDVAPDDDRREFLSVRDALRVAEEAFHPHMPDEKLLDLYMLVRECGAPDYEEVFDEIKEDISRMVLERMGEDVQPAPDARTSFDCPEHGKEALAATVAGGLPHEKLLMLYRLGWGVSAEYPEWQAVADICRAQILRRMNTPPQWDGGDWTEWERGELTRRLQAYP